MTDLEVIFSKHLVLSSIHETHPSTPVPGVITIKDSKISGLDLATQTYASAKSKYPDLNITDFSNYYISPGIIDLNTRKEWENIESLTRSAITGGVTITAVEQGYYNTSQDLSSLFCDVTLIPTVSDNLSVDSLDPSTLAVKLYFFPPAPNVKTVSNLGNLMQSIKDSKLTLFIDPTLPDPRMIYMASPLRLTPIEIRKDTTPKANTFFAAAFPNDAFSSESPSSEKVEDESPDFGGNRKMSLEANPEEVTKKRSVSDADPENLLQFPVLKPTESESKLRRSKKHLTAHDIYYDLDERVKACQNDMKDLSIAEEYSYSRSGSTSFISDFTPKKSGSLCFDELPSSLQHEPQSAEVLNRHSIRKNLIRPSGIVIKRESNPDVFSYYVQHLANYPEHWEITGIEKIVEHLGNNTKVHFQGISSVGALNRIRQLKQKFKHMSCEIPAAHLFFNSDSVTNGDTRFKNAPPIRNRGNFNLLWDLLKLKGIDLISSQHASIEPKLKPFGNFQQALNGIASIGCTLQAVWTVLNIPVTSQQLLEHYVVRLAKWLSLHPAQVLGIDKLRGSIEIGKYADLVVWDPWKREEFRSTYQNSPFCGQDLMGKIRCVYLRGVKVENEAIGQVVRI